VSPPSAHEADATDWAATSLWDDDDDEVPPLLVVPLMSWYVAHTALGCCDLCDVVVICVVLLVVPLTALWLTLQ
jgi:hypothetical protein